MEETCFSLDSSKGLVGNLKCIHSRVTYQWVLTRKPLEDNCCLGPSKGQYIAKAISLATPLPKKRTKYWTQFYPMKLGSKFQ